MPKLTVDARPREEVKYTLAHSRKNPNPVIPTGDYRHSSKIREGAISGEVWSQDQKDRWHEQYDGPPPAWGKLKEVVNAGKQVSEGSAEGVPTNAKTVRNKRGSKDILRNGEQEGQGKERERQSQKRIQKTKARKPSAQKKVEN